jgi:tRNA modification GTPase
VTVELPGGGEDTIAAIATAPGRSALAVVRVSGADAARVAGMLVGEGWPTADRVASLRTVRGPGGGPIDRAIVTRFAGPRSFTGEDVVEFVCHGGDLLPALVLDALLAAGARLALPGEFTRRAVLNGRIDLLQAEAIGDLIDASSRAAHRVALDQLDRGLSRRIEALRESFLSLEAMIAYDIDFPEEDEGPIPASRIFDAAIALSSSLQQLMDTARAGELVRKGALVVIAGAPNVGKSSLFNALLGRRRAIVTEIPGTTRDAIEAVIEAGNWPLRLVDTAGVRDTSDVVERMGIEVSTEYLQRADIVLACGESGAQITAVREFVAARTGAEVLPVLTKSDLHGAERPDDAIAVSAESGEGLRELISRIDSVLDGVASPPAPDMPILAHARHERAIGAALAEIREFREAWEAGTVPAPVAAVHLREGARQLEDLIGAVGVEDVLGRLFADFCVGK